MRGLRGFVIAGLLAILASSGLGSITHAEQENTRTLNDNQMHRDSALSARKQLILSVPDLRFEHWQTVEKDRAEYPYLYWLLHHAGLGALSARTFGKGLEDVYATIGAGAPAGSGSEAYGLNRLEEKQGYAAEQLYDRYRGQKPNEQSEVLIPEFSIAEQITSRSGFLAMPGLLGETLKARGIPVYTYGNTDGVHKARFSVLLLADRSGQIAHGDVSANMLVQDVKRPFGVRMDRVKLFQMWKAAPSESIVSIEWGDFSRLEESRNHFSVNVYEQWKIATLQELNAFIGMSLDDLRKDEGIWLLSSGPYRAARQPGTMLPLIYYETGIAPGLLTSASTRRAGIVTLNDLAPSLFRRYADESPAEMLGHPIEVMPSSEASPAWASLERQLEGIRNVYVLRPKLLLPFAGYEVFVLLAVLLCVNWAALSSKWGVRFLLRIHLLSLLIAPLVMLMLGWLLAVVQTSPGILVLLFVGLLIAGSTWGAAARTRTVAVGGIVSCITAAALLADGLVGAPGMKRSLLGYDPVVGARFYGMGNEFMGVLIGATVLAIAFGLDCWVGTRGGSHTSSAYASSSTVSEGAGAWVSLVSGSVEGAEPLMPRAAARVGAASDVLAPAGGSAESEAAEGAELTMTRAEAASDRRAQRARRLAAAAVCAVCAGVALYLATPQLGTNAGGAIAAVVAFGVACRASLPRVLARAGASASAAATRTAAPGQALASTRARRFGVLRLAIASLALTALAVAGLWLLNAVLPQPPGAQSHIGRAMGWLHEGRFDLVRAMAIRKLQMNIHLLGVSVWSKVLLAGLIVMLAVVLRPSELRRWQNSHPYLMDGCSAIAVGAIAALIFNDSGIVAAGTMIIFAAVPLLLLKLQAIDRQ